MESMRPIVCSRSASSCCALRRELGRHTDAGEPGEGIRRRLGRKGWATLAIFTPAAERSRARLEALLALDGVDEADRLLAQRLELLRAAARDPQLVHGEVVPDQTDFRGALKARCEAELIEPKLTIRVQCALGRDPLACLVIMDLDRAVAAPHDAIDHPLHPRAPRRIQGERHPLLDPERLLTIEGVVAPVEIAQRAHTDFTVERGVELVSHDPDALGVVRLIPVGLEAPNHLIEGGHAPLGDQDRKSVV
jgi:hypothetical protein